MKFLISPRIAAVALVPSRHVGAHEIIPIFACSPRRMDERLAGRGGRGAAVTDMIERSFLPAAVPEAAISEAVALISISARVEADTIWAAWALSDTVYSFDLNGELLDRLPVSLPTPIVLPTTPYERRSEAEMRDVEGITQVVGVFPVGGELAVQSQRKVTAGTIHDLVLMDRQGSLVWSAARMPMLHAVIGADFYFADPFSILPNRWIVARRKRED